MSTTTMNDAPSSRRMNAKIVKANLDDISKDIIVVNQNDSKRKATFHAGGNYSDAKQQLDYKCTPRAKLVLRQPASRAQTDYEDDNKASAPAGDVTNHSVKLFKNKSNFENYQYHLNNQKARSIDVSP